MALDIRKFASKPYLANIGRYKIVRDCYGGQDCIKAAAEEYLPRLKAQQEVDYQSYLYRALFFPITGKTAHTLVGMATGTPPEVKYPSELDPYFAEGEGSYQFTEFYVNTFLEIILQGRYGVLIDAPTIASDRTIISPYLAENIVRFEPDQSGNMELLLRECYYEPIEGSKYETKEKIRYRRLFIAGGTYYQQLLDDELEPMTPPVAPTFRGKTIDYLPFIPIGASGVHYSVDRPPMYDLATINLSHYLTSADLEWGRHIVGLPTPVVSGVDASTTLNIGGTSAWILPDPQAKAEYLEFQGQGLQSLETALSEKVSLMASASARLIDNSTRGSEAVDAVRLRYMSEAASLIHIVTSVENGLNMMYNMIARLHGAPETVSITFSREVLGVSLTFNDLKVLLEGYLTGAVSKESLLYNMKRLKAVDPKRTDEEELAAIKPPPPAKTAPTGNNAA
jgi:hypothetical protein